MDHWHAQSLLIRIISIFQQGFTVWLFLFFSVQRRRLTGSPSCHFLRRPRPLALRSIKAHPLPSMWIKKIKEARKGDVPPRSSSSPRGFTLYYVCMLSSSSPSPFSILRSIFPIPHHDHLLRGAFHGIRCTFSRCRRKKVQSAASLGCRPFFYPLWQSWAAVEGAGWGAGGWKNRWVIDFERGRNPFILFNRRTNSIICLVCSFFVQV